MSNKPILTDETGKEIKEAVIALKNILAPSGSVTITENGTYDVSEKASVTVNFPNDGVITPVNVNLNISVSEVTE